MNALLVGEVKRYQDQHLRPSCTCSFTKRIGLNERLAPQAEGGNVEVLKKDAIWTADFISEVGQYATGLRLLRMRNSEELQASRRISRH